jgi:hypothetical protein
MTQKKMYLLFDPQDFRLRFLITKNSLRYKSIVATSTISSFYTQTHYVINISTTLTKH